MKKILVSGSLAYDKIMDFPGKFSDYILPDKIHNLNVAFGIDSIQDNFGGTAGNIAHNLALLQEQPVIFSTAGNDFEKYKNWLELKNIDTSKIVIVKEVPTATAYITTDQSDNQITGFFMGAMKTPAENISVEDLKDARLAIVSPGNKKDMGQFSPFYKKNEMWYIFDPGQPVPSFNPQELSECIMGAWALIANDYEISFILEKTKLTKKEILKHCEVVITTLGEKGSSIELQKERYEIPVAKPNSVLDPTGAGDAYRAGLIKGIANSLSWEVCGRLGAVVSAYTVEKYGTQTHEFTLEEVKNRYRENFGEEIDI